MLINNVIKEEFKRVQFTTLSNMALGAFIAALIFFVVRAFVAVKVAPFAAMVFWGFALASCKQINITRQTTPVIRGAFSAICAASLTSFFAYFGLVSTPEMGLLCFGILLVGGFI